MVVTVNKLFFGFVLAFIFVNFSLSAEIYFHMHDATYNNSENCILIKDTKRRYYNRFNQLWEYYE